MKVIFVGFGPHLSHTMAIALNELGYENYDFFESYEKLGDKWMKIFVNGGTTKDIQLMLKDVDSVTGFPACYFCEEIQEAFPQVKIIFSNEVSEEAWWKDLKKYFKLLHSIDNLWFAFLSPSYNRFQNYLGSMCKSMFGNLVTTSWTGKKTFNKLAASITYRQHNVYVLENTPEDNFLLFDFKDGWEPLCKFLDKPIPQTQFPDKDQEDYSKIISSSLVFKRIRFQNKISLGLASCISILLISRLIL